MSRSVSRSVVRVGLPAAGTTRSISLSAGAALELGFPEGEAIFERSGKDLLIGLNGGGSVTVGNFFAVGELPVMKLHDGVEVAGKEFLSLQSPDMDLSPASGPTSGGSESTYADGAGKLIAGVSSSALNVEADNSFQWKTREATPESFRVSDPTEAHVASAAHTDAAMSRGVGAPLGNPTPSVLGAATDTIVDAGILYVKGNILDGVYTPEGGTQVDTGKKVDFGADGPAGGVPSVEWAKGGSFQPTGGGTAVSLTLNARGHLIGSDGKDYGMLTLKSNGDYTYTKVAGNSFDGEVRVNFTIEDGDGDRATAPVVFRVTDAGVELAAPHDAGTWDPLDPGKGGSGYDLVAYESKLDKAQDGAPNDGSQADGKETWTMAKTYGFTCADGLASIAIESASGEVLTLKPGAVTSGTVAGEYGSLRVELTEYDPSTGVGRVTYSYHLDTNVEHNPGKGQNTDLAGVDERFSMTLSDRDGDTGSATLNVVIVDDAPSLTLDGGDSVAAGATLTGSWSHAYNADGPGSMKVIVNGTQYNVGDAVDTGKGILIVKADGTWTFEGAKGLDMTVAQKVSFSLKITDSDNDSVVLKHDVSISKADGPTWDDVTGDSLVLHEIHARGGAAEFHEMQVGFTAGAEDIVTYALDLATGADAPKVIAGGVALPISWAKVGDALIGSQNGVDVIKLEVVGSGIIGAYGSGSVTVQATLLHVIDHGMSPNTDGVTIDGLLLTATDRNGESVTAHMTVAVEDDKPAVSVYGPSTVAEGTTLTDTWTHSYNADGAGNLKVFVAGKEYSIGDAIDTGKGILTVKADGTWTFQAATNLNNSVTQAVNFTVKITDKDGDSVASNHYLQITGGDGPTWVDPSGGSAFGNNIALHEVHTRGGVADSHAMQVGFTAGSDDITGFALNLGTGAGAPSVIAGGVELPITWAKVGNALIGSQNGVAVIKLELVAPASIAAQTSGEVEVKATLLGPIMHGEHPNTDTVSINGLELTVTDRDGDSVTAKLSVTVEDDKPEIAVSGGGTVVSGELLEGTWSHDYNADGAGGLKIIVNGTEYNVGDVIDTGKGILTVKADGTWSFQSAAGQPVGEKIEFELKITDNDGDTAGAKHEVRTVADGGPIWVDPSGGGNGNDIVLHEMHSRGGNADVHLIQVGFSAGDEDIVNYSLDLATGADAPKVIAGGVELPITWTKVGDALIGSQNGVDVIKLEMVGLGVIGAHSSGNVTVKATLLEPIMHGEHPNTDNVTIDGLRLTVTDRSGESATAKMTVGVEDDKPTVSVYGDSSVAGGHEVSGTWTHDYNADGPGSLKVIFNGTEYNFDDAIDTGKGILTVKADGTWTFDAASTATAQSLSFTVKITDSDGDTVSSNHYLAISPDGKPGPTWIDPGTGDLGDNIAVHEAHLRGGAAESHTMQVGFTAGTDDITGFSLELGTGADAPKVYAGGVELPLTWAKVGNDLIGSQNGVAVVKLELVAPTTIAALANGEVEVKATLLEPIMHGEHPNTDTVTITGLQLTVTDSDGDTATAKMSVTIDDDKPVVEVLGGTSMAEGATLNGTWTHDYNADGAGSLKVVFNGTEYNVDDAIDTGKGILTVKADGTWTFQAASNLVGTNEVAFSLKITDADGDTAVSEHKVSIADTIPNGPTWIDPGTGDLGDNIAVHEAHLRGGAAESHTMQVGFTAGTDDITGFSLDLGTGADAPKVYAGGVELPLTWAKVGNDLIGSQNGVAVVKLELVGATTIAAGATGEVEVKATLLEPIMHGEHPNTDSVTITGLHLTVTDTDGDAATAKMSVTIEDDKPVVDVIGGTSVAGGATLNGTWTHDYNADGAGELKVVFNGTEYNVGDAIDTGKGTLTVKADGTWTFEAASTTTTQNISFGVKITDKDGDTAVDNHSLSITGNGGPTWIDPGTGDLGNNVAVHDAHLRGGAAESHTMKVGFTAGSDDITGFSLELGTGADAPKVYAGGVELPLTWNKIGNDLVGYQNGVAVVKLELVGATTITAGVTGDVSVKATLLEPVMHGEHPNTDTVTITGLNLKVTDSDGDTAAAKLSVTIEDDKPVVGVSGSTSLGYGQTVSGTWTHDYNADGAGSLKVVVGGVEYNIGDAIDTGKGILTVKADGTWTFAADPTLSTSAVHNVAFGVKITDSDGDTATRSHSLVISDGDGPRWIGDGGGDIIYLHDAHTRGGVADSHTFKIGFEAGTADIVGFSLEIGTTKVIAGGVELPLTWAKVGNDLIGSQNGVAVIKLELTGTGTIASGTSDLVGVKATLLQPLTHGETPNTDTVTIEGLSLAATDSDGRTAQADLLVMVADDMPEVSVFGAATVAEGQLTSGGWVHAYNADGAGSLVVVFNGTEYHVGDAINTGNGTLTVKADGTWVFKSNTNLDMSTPQSAEFSVIITDSDGDTASSSHTVVITPGEGPTWIDPGTGDLGNNVAVHDTHLRGGAAESHSMAVEFKAGGDDITGFSLELGTGADAPKVYAGGVELPLTWAKVGNDLIGSQNGVAVVKLELVAPTTIAALASGEVEVKATLLEPVMHGEHPNTDSVTITGLHLTATDTDGDSVTAKMSVTIDDDKPVVDVLGATTVAGGAALNGTWTHDYNADGAGELKVVFNGTEYNVGDAIDTGNGTLTVKADGTWSFVAKTNLDMSTPQTANFSVKITDSDGDTTTSAHDVTITKGAPPTWDKDPSTGDLGDNVAVHDAHLRGGAAESHTMKVGFTAGSDDITGFSLGLGTGADAPKVFAGGVELPLTWAKVGNDLIGSQNGVAVVKLELVAPTTIAALTSGEVEVKATLLEPVMHGEHPNMDMVVFTGLQLTATDLDGDTATAKMSVTIEDDKPTLTVDLDPTTEILPGGSESGQLNLVEGGDGINWNSFTVDGKAVAWNTGTNTGSVTVDNGKFDLVYNPATGKMSYTFTADTGIKTDVQKDYAFKLSDKDGDETGVSLHIDIKGGIPIIGPVIPTNGTEFAVHEDGLSWGTHKGEAAHPITTSGMVEIESNSGLDSVTIDGHVIDLPAGWTGSTYTPTGATWSMTDGTLTIDNIRYNPTSLKYEVNFTYKLTTNTTAHSDPTNSHEKLSTGDAAAQAAMPQFTITVTDNAGLTSDPGLVKVDIYDDGPQLGFSHPAASGDGHVHLDNSYLSTGTLTPNYGADRAAGSGDDYLDVTFQGTRHIMINGSPVAYAFNETVHASLDSSGKGVVYTGLGYIEFSKQPSGAITYTYLAKHGLKGDSETLTFTVADGDGDTAKQSYIVEMDFDVPAGTSYVDEAGLAGLGSHHPGYYESTQHFEVILPMGTTNVSWDLAAITANTTNALKADANGDGLYSNVTWSVDGSGKLIGTAEGKVILSVTQQANPTPDGHGNYTSTFSVELHAPIQHPSGAGYNIKSLFLDFKATSPDDKGGTMVTSNAVSVAIVDDAPSVLEKNLDVVESVVQGEDVYLVLDISGSITNADLTKGIQALQALVQKYIDLGIESKFSLVAFGADSAVRADHLDPNVMLNYLKTQNATTMRDGLYGNTNYDSGLDVAQRLIEAGMQDGTTREYLQKVYFISDGEPNTTWDTTFSSWKAFVQNHKGTAAGVEQIEVYAVGVGNALSSTASWNMLMTVTADDPATHGIKVNSYSDLANQLTGLVQPGVTAGNLFGEHRDNNDVASADLTFVTSATFGGVTKVITAAGTTFTYDGVTLTIFADGKYTISSTKSVTGDLELPLSYTLRDADGDTSTTQNVKIIVHDAKPEAFDNVAGGAEVDYKAAIAGSSHVMLDDFGARSASTTAWYASQTAAVTYNTTYSTTNYVNINGATGSSAGVSFVKIAAGQADYSGSQVSFSLAMRDITGKTVSELFSNGSPGSTGNASSSDNPQYGAYIEKSVDLLTAGALKFNFVFSRGTTSGTYSASEHAFAVLKDAKGNVVWSGLIEPNPSGASGVTSGVCSIPVAKAGQYTLIIGCYDNYGSTLPNLYVDQVVFTPETTHGQNVYHGNMVEDLSPLGQMDTRGDHAVLQKITVNNHDYMMVAAGLVLHDVFTTGDLLTVSATGEYSYQTPADSFDNVNIGYTLKEPGSSDVDSATVYVRSDDYRHEGTSGNDNIDLSGKSGSHVVTSGEGNDTITGSHGNDVIFTGHGHNTVNAGDGNDTIHLGNGGNLVHAGAGNDLIHGGAGSDTIYGGDGNDTIYGGAGDDIIYGGKGSDVMYGGDGYDVFAWAKTDYEAASVDKVMDFTLREDRLSFADIFGATPQVNVALKDILDALDHDRLNLSAADRNNVTIMVNDTTGHLQQTVEVHLEGNGIDASLLTDILNNDDAAKALLLQQMLTNLGG